MALDIAAQKDKSMEEKEKEAKDEGINVVIGQRPEVPVTDKLEESASGRGSSCFNPTNSVSRFSCTPQR